MRKLFFLSHVAVMAITLQGCGTLKRSPNNSTSKGVSSVSESTTLDDEIFEKIPPKNEYTHAIAEATADDVVISQSAGVQEIDDELEPTEEDKIPYARDFLLPKKTKRMQFWVEYFTKKERARFQRFIDNGEEYRHHIEKIFVEAGLPKELYFVGLIESGYYLSAKSHASAVGPWQFIKGTGTRYGLRTTAEFDERQDLFKASKAAAAYFKDLHNIFSSWELALAAYNAGEYGIIRRILKHGTRDFYQMSKNKQLPSETINYVPKVLAAMHVVNNAEKYGFDIPKKKHRLFDRTELKAIKRNVPLKTIANRLNVDLNLLKKLNPELKKGSTPKYVSGSYYLRVPKTKYNYRLIEVEGPAAVELAAISKPESRKELNRRTASASVPVPLKVKATTHTVKRGETLVSISRKYKMTPRELAEANDFKTWKTRVKVGQKLSLVETEDKVVTVAAAPRVKISKGPIVYKVKTGDNLTDLARIFKVNLKELKTTNRLRKNSIMVGQKIVLPDSQKGIYTVQRGDNLTHVARELKQPMEMIVKLNSLKRKAIYPGQKLIVNMD